MIYVSLYFLFFFFNDTATTEIYTLSLHDALPISPYELLSRLASSKDRARAATAAIKCPIFGCSGSISALRPDRKSTRLNSSHLVISYAVFCLKKKKKSYTGLHSIRRSTISALTRH